jgi:hypothetical protein
LGAEQQRSFNNIKKISAFAEIPPVMKAPNVGILFWLYIIAKDSIIVAVFMQAMDGQGHIITYLSRRLIYYAIHGSEVYPCFMLIPS